MEFEASLMLIKLQWRLFVTVKGLEVQTVDGDDAKSVQEFGDCVGDKQLLANSYMVVTVTVTHI